MKRILEHLLPKETTGDFSSQILVVELGNKSKEKQLESMVNVSTPVLIKTGDGLLGAGPSPLQTPGNFSYQSLAQSLYSGPFKLYKWDCPKFSGEDFKE